MALTVTQLREHITTSLVDAALTRLLNAAYEAIREVAGPSGNVSELLGSTSGPLLMLSQPASAIVSVKEDTTTLVAADYQLRPSGQMLVRLDTGPNPRSRWQRPDITYTPAAGDAERDRVAIELVRLDVDYKPGIASQAIGPWSESFAAGGDTYAAERAAILATLNAAVIL